MLPPIEDPAISRPEHMALFIKVARPDAMFVATGVTGENGDVTVLALPRAVRMPFTGHNVGP